jgi:2-methylcitrate dehydratase PrpD
MQPGFAAQAGVEAAYLARAGISGSREFLEGPYGFYNLYERGAYDPGPVQQGLGRGFLISQLSIKPYPCCRMTHSSIDAALALHPQVAGRQQKIQRVEVRASSMVTEMVGKAFVLGDDPQVDAQFSIPYTVSAALLRGDVFLGDFEPAAIQDPAARELARKVAVTSDPGLAPKDILPAAMAITLPDGERLSAEVRAPLGNPARPMSRAQCREKFNKCLAYSGLPRERAWVEEVLTFIENLERAPDAAHLAPLISD